MHYHRSSFAIAAPWHENIEEIDELGNVSYGRCLQYRIAVPQTAVFEAFKDLLNSIAFRLASSTDCQNGFEGLISEKEACRTPLDIDLFPSVAREAHGVEGRAGPSDDKTAQPTEKIRTTLFEIVENLCPSFGRKTLSRDWPRAFQSVLKITELHHNKPMATLPTADIVLQFEYRVDVGYRIEVLKVKAYGEAGRALE